MKKILMLAPFFFEYEKRIKEELENQGYFVSLYNDYTTYVEKYNFIEKFSMKILRQKKKIKNQRKMEYFERILKKESQNYYDIIFVIKGSVIPEFFLKEMKNINEKAEWIAYEWDDISNCKDFLNNRDYFDKIYSYSLEDSKKYNFIYRPFFYSQKRDTILKKYDLSFIGTLHSDRGDLLQLIINKIKTIDIKFYCKIFIERERYFRKRLWLKSTKNLYITQGIPYNEVMNIFSNSKAILEIQHPRQKTITTRSIEALGTKTKVITTVQNIKKYDFYNEDNYLIINRENLEFSKEWLNKPYKDIDDDILKYYSLKTWVGEIFER
ncbi:MAG: hypothetical protein ACRCZR_01835 [Cetobacterium sp.]